jgi:hypothetical protein
VVFDSKRKGHDFHDRGCQLKGRTKAATSQAERSTILVIPDTQVKAGVPNDHLLWLHDWALHRYAGKPLTVVHLGDHWDMPSLSSYDRGKGKMEGRRYQSDIAAGNRGMELLTEGRDVHGASWRDQPWDLHFLFGNHEDRITRAVDSNVQLEGLLSLDSCETPGWTRHGFREIVTISGINFSHYFYNVNTGRPHAGENLETRLKTIGAPFVMGHQQGLKVANRPVLGKLQRALVCGSFYQHDEEYLGPQGNDHWRGIVVLNNVRPTGEYSLMEVELDYLCGKYAGHQLSEHRGEEL